MRSDIDAEDLALCGDKDDNGKLVDDQVCLCDTDLCYAMWKNSGIAVTDTAISIVSILVIVFLH